MADDDGGNVEPTQSLPLCILFTGISGLLRVVATMVLAYPEFLQKKQGASEGATSKSLYLAAHLFILAVSRCLSQHHWHYLWSRVHRSSGSDRCMSVIQC
jgi:hypothetical protein